MTVAKDGAATITAYAYDKNNRLTSETTGGATVVYAYDRNGNMLGKSGQGVAVTQTFDLLNRMSGWTDGASSAAYTYNPDNMRRTKTVDGATTEHVWIGTEIALDVTGSAVVSYVAGIKSDYGWHVYNAHGDVVQLADGSGAVIRSYDYDPFGNQLQETDGLDMNPYRYNRQYYDTESGYVYLRMRYYDPQTSRMLSEDPIRDGFNWYIYAGNNPIMYHDPSGLERVIVSGGTFSNREGYQLEFIDSALRMVLSLSGSERITWLIADVGLTNDIRDRISQFSADYGFNVVYFTDVREINDYINNGYDNNRASDPITLFRLYAHGYAGSIEFGREHGAANDRERLIWTIDMIRGLSPGAFRSPNSHFFSCNTATITGGTSFAQEWHNRAGGYTVAAVGQTNYSRINARGMNIISKGAYLNARNAMGGYELPFPSFRSPVISSRGSWAFFPADEPWPGPPRPDPGRPPLWDMW